MHLEMAREHPEAVHGPREHRCIAEVARAWHLGRGARTWVSRVVLGRVGVELQRAWRERECPGQDSRLESQFCCERFDREDTPRNFLGSVNFCAALRRRRLRRRAARGPRSGALLPPRGCQRAAAQRRSRSARTECTWAATRHLSCVTQQVCLAQLAPSVTLGGTGPRVHSAPPLCRAPPAARALK